MWFSHVAAWLPKMVSVPSASILTGEKESESEKDRGGDRGRGRNSQVEPVMILQGTIYSDEFYLLEKQVAKTGSYSRGRTDSTFDRRSVEEFGDL